MKTTAYCHVWGRLKNVKPFDVEPSVEELLELHDKYDCLKVVHSNDHISLFIKNIFDGHFSLDRYVKNYKKVLAPYERETFDKPHPYHSLALASSSLLKVSVSHSNSGRVTVYAV